MTQAALPQLRLFKQELWKDQRQLRTRDSDKGLTLVKQFASGREGETELYVLEALSELAPDLGVRVPAVAASNTESVELEYVRGIRLFNLLVELDRLPADLRQRGTAIKRQLLDRAEANQRTIQRALIDLPSLSHWRPYPAGTKIKRIIEILAPSLDIVVNEDALARELTELDNRWIPMANVPFRDATTKNMVLADRGLWMGEFDGEDARRASIISSLRDGGTPTWLTAPLIDFDFASCGELSTPEDDVISLLFHERTWRQAPSSPREVLWDDSQPDPERAALSFLTRFYRFGGRKAAYRLLHPWGHQVRFRHDGDIFYFERLSEIVRRLSPRTAEDFPMVMSITTAIARTLDAGRPGVDRFIAAGLGEKRNYFVDMYWDRPPT